MFNSAKYQHLTRLLCSSVCFMWILFYLLFITPMNVHGQDEYERALQSIEEARESEATALDLAGFQLLELPPEIGQLEHLQELDLSHNRLTSLPPEFGQLQG